MTARILFLDIDGVLNGHRILRAAGCCGIDRKCVAQLTRIVRATECSIVLSSAWRYMVHGGAMTLDGFGYMLRTHGAGGVKIIGVTPPDEIVGPRGAQITYWLRMHKTCTGLEPLSYVVVDDDDLGISDAGHPLVLTDGKVGLTRAAADLVIEIFRGGFMLPTSEAAVLAQCREESQ